LTRRHRVEFGLSPVLGQLITTIEPTSPSGRDEFDDVVFRADAGSDTGLHSVRSDRTALNITEVAVVETGDIRIGVLGPLQVHSGEARVTLPGRRPSIVLASLAMSAGRMVSLETLADHVWGDQLPLSATDSLRSLVSRLRLVVGSTARKT